MQIHKTEITTGILVLVTTGVLIALLVYIGMPGVIKPLNTYRLYFDNANGIRPGAPVFLAGREIGKVTVLQSPVALDQRPKDHANYEVSIDVQVDRDAEIYRKVTVRLAQQGLMGQQAIDFVQGDAESGLAEDHTKFVGERVPDIGEAMSRQFKELAGPDSDLAATIKNTKVFMQSLNDAPIQQTIKNAEKLSDSLNTLTGTDSDLAAAFKNTKTFTESLNNSPIKETIKNAEKLTDSLNSLTGADSELAATIKKAKTFVDSLNNAPIQETVKNAEQLTDTLKRQPWRLFWPSSKSYPDEGKPDTKTLKGSDSGNKKQPHLRAAPTPQNRRER